MNTENGLARRQPLQATALAALAALAVTLPCHAQEGDVRRVHDPCIIGSEGWYYVFSTGRGIPIRRSKDLLHWEHVGSVFDELPPWARNEVPEARGLWAPDVSFFEGKYHLYYAVSTFGRNRSCIGLAVNNTLDPKKPAYRWVDRGKVIESRTTDRWNAIDPNIIFDDRGRGWLSFGSFWSGIKLQPIDTSTGRPGPDARMLSLSSRPSPGAVEAPFMIHRGGYYYLFVSFDFCARGVESTYRIMVGRSRDITGPFVDWSGRPMLEGGGTVVLSSHGAVRGPGHCAVLAEDDRHWLVHHFYDARAKGVATLQIRPLLWDRDGWPLAGEPHTAPVDDARQPGPAELVASWDYSVDFGEPRRITFEPGGRIAGGDATWSLSGSRLLLNGLEPSGPVVCTVWPDGKWYVGRTVRGQVARGIHVAGAARPAPKGEDPPARPGADGGQEPGPAASAGSQVAEIFADVSARRRLGFLETCPASKFRLRR